MTESNKAELTFINKIKACLTLNGYQHYHVRQEKGILTWRCVNEKSSDCKGSVNTDIDCIVLNKTNHSCTINVLNLDWKNTVENWKKRAREELTVPIKDIYHEEYEKLSSTNVTGRIPTIESIEFMLHEARIKKEKDKACVKPLLKQSSISSNSSNSIQIMQHLPTETVCTSKGKPCLVLDGYQHRMFRKRKEYVEWRCMRDKNDNCKGKVKTKVLDYTFVISKANHSCTPNEKEIDWKRIIDICKKRVCDELCVPVSTIFNEELGFMSTINCKLMPVPSNIKAALYRHRRKALRSKFNFEEKNTEDTFKKINIIEDNCAEILLTQKGGKRLLFDGYRHKIYQSYASSGGRIYWSCVKRRSQYCNGGLRTTRDNLLLDMSAHSCISKLDWVEKVEFCKKRACEELSVSVNKIFQDEIIGLISKGHYIRFYRRVKSLLYRERRTVLCSMNT